MNMLVHRIYKLLVITSLLFISCNIPKDPHHSWQNAQNNGLKVGMVSQMDVKKKSLLQTEKAWMEDFAKENNMEILFIENNETDLIERLKNYNIEIMIGAFEKKSIWKKEVGMTLPYDGKHVMFIPKGENELLYHLEKFLNNK